MKAQTVNFTQGGNSMTKLNIGQRREGVMFSKFPMIGTTTTYEEVIDKMIDNVNDLSYGIAMEYQGGPGGDENFAQKMQIHERENFEDANKILQELEIKLDNLFEILDNTQIPS